MSFVISLPFLPSHQNSHWPCLFRTHCPNLYVYPHFFFIAGNAHSMSMTHFWELFHSSQETTVFWYVNVCISIGWLFSNWNKSNWEHYCITFQLTPFGMCWIFQWTIGDLEMEEPRWKYRKKAPHSSIILNDVNLEFSNILQINILTMYFFIYI